jgi:hypothetical protein
MEAGMRPYDLVTLVVHRGKRLIPTLVTDLEHAVHNAAQDGGGRIPYVDLPARLRLCFGRDYMEVVPRRSGKG